jgi:hypothetical protein
VHWAFVGNLDEALALLFREIAVQGDGAIDSIEHAFLGLAVLAINSMDARMRKRTITPSSGIFLRSAYTRSVMDVQAPNPASTRS